MSKKTPEGWSRAKVGELSVVKRGASPRPIQDPKWWGGKVGWVRISDVTSSRKYLTKTTQYLSEEGVRKSVQITKGEVVLSICATIGRPIIIQMDACIHDGFVWFDKLKNTIDREYWYYFLSSQESYLSSQRQSGTQGNLNTSIVAELECLLPPFSEQQKIATILTSVDNVIETTRAQIDKLKDLKTGMMQELLTKGIGHTEFKDSPVGRIPVPWKTMPLGAACELEVGYAFKSEWFSDSGVRLLRGDNVGYGIPTWERIQYLSEEQAKNYSRYLLDVDDVIIGMDRTFTKSGAKITKIGSSDIPSLLVQRVGKFVPKKYTMRFLWQLVRSPAFVEGLKNQEKGMDIPHLSKNEILSCVVVLPPSKEQEEIADVLEVHDTLIECEREKLITLEKMKKALMQDLLTARVRVTLNP